MASATENDIPPAEQCRDCGWDGTLYWAGNSWLCDDCLAQRGPSRG